MAQPKSRHFTSQSILLQMRQISQRQSYQFSSPLPLNKCQKVEFKGFLTQSYNYCIVILRNLASKQENLFVKELLFEEKIREFTIRGEFFLWGGSTFTQEIPGKHGKIKHFAGKIKHLAKFGGRIPLLRACLWSGHLYLPGCGITLWKL